MNKNWEGEQKFIPASIGGMTSRIHYLYDNDKIVQLDC